MINCDMGEELIPSPDEKIMPYINMANIACGAHAGDNNSIDKTIKLAKKHSVLIGVHPSYPDKTNFGRIKQNLSGEELTKTLSKQVQNFINICNENSTNLEYIKPHGALYHQMMQDEKTLKIICEVAKKFKVNKLVVQYKISEQMINNICNKYKITPIFEAFADRKYENWKLVDRKYPKAVLKSAVDINKQYHIFKKNLDIDTICFHSDNKASVIALKQINTSL